MGPGTAFPPIPREDRPVRAACLCNIIKYSTREKPVDETLFSTVLENTIEDFNDYLKELEHPVIGTVDFYGNTIQYSSEEELEYIKEFSERFNVRTAPIFEYCHNNRGCCIPEVYNALTDIKNDEIKRLNKHLKYKVDPNKVACIKFL
jgi:hypothetical protein